MKFYAFAAVLSLGISLLGPRSAHAQAASTSQLQKAMGFNTAVYNVLDAMGNDRDAHRWGRALVLLQTARSLTVNTDVRAELDAARDKISNGPSNGGTWPDPSDATADEARTALMNAIRLNRYVVREKFGEQDRKVVSNLLLRVFFPNVETHGIVDIHVVPTDQDRWAPNTCLGDAAELQLAGRSLTKVRPARPPESRGMALLMNLALDPRAQQYDPDVKALLEGRNAQGGESDDQIIFCVTTGTYALPARADDPMGVKTLDLMSTYAGLTIQGGDLMTVPVVGDRTIAFKLEYKGLKSVPAVLHFVRNYTVLRGLDARLMEPLANSIARIAASLSVRQSGAFSKTAVTQLEKLGVWADNMASKYSGLQAQNMARALTAQERIDRIAAQAQLHDEVEIAANPKVQAINQALEEMHGTTAYQAAEAAGDEAAMSQLDSIAARSADPLEMSNGISMGAKLAVGAMIAFYGFETWMEWRRTNDPDEHRLTIDEYAPFMIEAPLYLIPVVGWGLAGYDTLVSAYNMYAESTGKTPYHVQLSDALRPMVDYLWEHNVEAYRSVAEILSPLQDRMQLPRVIERGADADQALIPFQKLVEAETKAKKASCTLQFDRGMFYLHIREMARSFLAYLNIGRERFGERTQDYYNYEGRLAGALFDGDKALFPQETALLARADRLLGSKNACSAGLNIQLKHP